MDRLYARDFFDGEEVPELVVRTDGRVPNDHRGSIHIEGAEVRLDRTHQGSLWLWDGARVELADRNQGSLHLENSSAFVAGSQQGSVHVGAGSTVRVTGRVQGSVHVERGGEFHVERSGQHQGSVYNSGVYVLKGARGGSYDGDGEYIEEPGSLVKQPVIKDGMATYKW